jgi:hypothetical protein
MATVKLFWSSLAPKSEKASGNGNVAVLDIDISSNDRRGMSCQNEELTRS